MAVASKAILHGAIQPDLYKKETVLVEPTGTAGTSRLGRIHFRLRYDCDRSDLLVHVIEAHDLASEEHGGFNDPYVKVSVVPETDCKGRQTKIHRCSTNPYFNEHFKFPIPREEIFEKCLLLQVFDYDKYSRNDVVGEVRLQLGEIDITSDTEVWSEIRKAKKPPGNDQEILFSLSYLPSAERLTVVVMKARNLVLPAAKFALDPYVKVYMMINGKKVKKKKTSCRRGSNDPVWNEAVSFNVVTDQLPDVTLEMIIVNHDRIGKEVQVGTCAVGPKEDGQELIHWQDMVQNMRKSVAMWHKLV